MQAGWSKGTRAPRVLIRACWQSFCMGEVAQVAGLLRIFQREAPEIKLTVWASSLTHGVGEWLKHHFPKVKFITGTNGNDGKPDQPALQQAWADCDFLLHGPSTRLAARDHLEAWQKHARKPFGIYGVTLDAVDDKLRALLEAASFVFLRDGASRALAIRQGVTEAKISFVPDAALAMDLRAPEKADAWLQTHGLTDKPFICVVTKLRYTPYWQIFGRDPRTGEIAQAQRNDQCQEADHALLREALQHYLTATEAHLVCVAEMPYQIELGKDLIVAKLPESMRSRCVVRDEPWLPDEAASIFAKAQLVLSLELLSAVVAETAGTPGIHVRPPTDATQGQMWADLGLGGWLFELENLTGKKLGEALLQVKEDPESRARIVAKANEFIHEREKAGMQRLRQQVGLRVDK